jgi:hypothetical protein
VLATPPYVVGENLRVVEAAAKVLDLIKCTACGDFINPGCNAKNKHRSCPKNTLKSALAKIKEGK